MIVCVRFICWQVAFEIPVTQKEPKPTLTMKVMEGDDPYEVSPEIRLLLPPIPPPGTSDVAPAVYASILQVVSLKYALIHEWSLNGPLNGP
jgi:hypothetical protein